MLKALVSSYFLLLSAVFLLSGCIGGTSVGSRGVAAFNGVSGDGCTLLSSIKEGQPQTIVKLVWKAHKPFKKGIVYNIYGGAGDVAAIKSRRLDRTTNTFYELNLTENEMVKGVLVTAQDGETETSNENILAVPCGSGSNAPPEFGGLKFAAEESHRSILLKWDLCPKEACLYYVYLEGYKQAITKTTDNHVFIYSIDGQSNLVPNTTYRFVVRAQNSAGILENNTIVRSVTTTTDVRPVGGWITRVSRPEEGGIPALSELVVEWVPSPDAFTGTAFWVSTNGRDLPSYTPPGPAPESSYTRVTTGLKNASYDPLVGYYVPSTVTKATIGSLLEGTDYCIQARPFLKVGSQVFWNKNRRELCQSTLSRVPPTFYGGTKAVAAQGVPGFSTAVISWGNPGNDGVYTGFVIDYDGPQNPGDPDAKCTDSGAFFTSARRFNVNSTSARSAEVSGLLAKRWYRFWVRTVFKYLNQYLFSKNQDCLDVYMSPEPPYMPNGGVVSASLPAGVAGFRSADVFITLTPPKGSFSFWEIRAKNVSTGQYDVIDTSLTNKGTEGVPLIKTISGLIPMEDYVISVTPVFHCGPRDDNVNCNKEIVLKDPVAEAKTVQYRTEPRHERDITYDAQALTPDLIRVTFSYDPNALNDEIHFYKSCGQNAKNDVIAKYNASPSKGDIKHDASTSPGFQDFGSLTADVPCAFLVRGIYSNPNGNEAVLLSENTRDPVIAIPSNPPPNCVDNPSKKDADATAEQCGVVSAVRLENQSGFTTAIVTWNKVPEGGVQAQRFSYYQGAYADHPSKIKMCAKEDPCTPAEEIQHFTDSNIKNGSRTIPNILPENKTFYFKVRVVNAFGTPPKANGETPYAILPPLPRIPQGDGTKQVGADSSTSLFLVHNVPASSGGGVWSDVIAAIRKGGTSSDWTNFFEGRKIDVAGRLVLSIKFPGTGYPTNAINATASSLTYTFPSPPTEALIRFPASLLKAGQDNTLVFRNLETGQLYWLGSRTVNLEDGYPDKLPGPQTSHYLENVKNTSPFSKEPGQQTPFFPNGTGDQKDGIRTTKNAPPDPADDLNIPGYGTSEDFSQIRVKAPPVTAGAEPDCKINVAVYEHDPANNVFEPTNYDDENFWDSKNHAGTYPEDINCQSTEQNIDIKNLVTGKKYRVRVRARNSYNGGTLVRAAGQYRYGIRTVRPEPPAGYTIVSVKHNSPRDAGGPCTLAEQTGCYTSTALPARQRDEMLKSLITWTLPTNNPVLWNTTLIFKANNTDKQAAIDKVVDDAKAINNYTAIKGQFYHSTGNTTTTTFTDNSVDARGYTCYRVVPAWYDANAKQYSPGSVDETFCIRPKENLPTSLAVSNLSTSGTWPSDGTAKLLFTFNQTVQADQDIDGFNIYISHTPPPSKTPQDIAATFRTDLAPWMKIDRGAQNYDDADDAVLYAGGQGRTVGGSTVYYYVQTRFGAAPGFDVNTSYSSLTLPSYEANYVFAPKSLTGLAYDFYIMAFEASVKSGSVGSSSTDRVLLPEQTATALDSPVLNDLTLCNNRFHDFKIAGGSTPNGFCVSKGSPADDFTATFHSAANKAPVNVNFHQAWIGCRNSSDDAVWRSRLPTEEEWRRVSKWQSDEYSKMEAVYRATGAYSQSGCNQSTGLRTTGKRPDGGFPSDCRNSLGIFDMAGNMAEWVDNRMVARNTSVTGEARPFTSKGHTVGVTVQNAIDNTVRRFHSLNPPGPNYLALLMGSYFGPATALSNNFTVNGGPVNTRAWDPETESWRDPTKFGYPSNSAGNFGVRCVAFTPATVPSAAQRELPHEPTFDPLNPPPAHAMPSPLYWNDTWVEKVKIGNDYNNPKVTFTWQPWVKKPGSAVTRYYLWRFIDPSRPDMRSSILWANTDSPQYTLPTPLDPWARTSANGLTWSWTQNTSSGAVGLIKEMDAANVCNSTECKFEDTTFNKNIPYLYLLVAKDNVGNTMAAKYPVTLSPYFASEPPYSNTAPVQTRYRYRRMVFYLDKDAYWAANPGLPQQRMKYVPMDTSGLHHDFYIYQYEASYQPGSQTDDFTGSEKPAGADTNGNWVPDAAICHDNAYRLNATGGCSPVVISFESRSGATAAPQLSWGGAQIGCRLSTFTDANGKTRRLRPITMAENMSASDWGDTSFPASSPKVLKHEDSEDYPPSMVNELIDTIEKSGDSNSAYCLTSGSGPGLTGAKSKCRSRYGAYDMVGNVPEITVDSIRGGVGLDNGIYPSILGHFLAVNDGVPVAFDFFYGFGLADANGVGIKIGYNTGTNSGYSTFNEFKPMIRSSGWGSLSTRFSTLFYLPPFPSEFKYGARCGY